ncbi:hypothetical protein MMC15_001398 [Xylographa vitiligo]|nr:hypothetical protein [Xylographa vitiligo]
MLAIPLLLAVLFVRSGLAVLDEIICHDDFLQRSAPNPGVHVARSERIISLMERAFLPILTPLVRHNMADLLESEHYPPLLARLYATPQPLDHPATATECLAAASLIPDPASYIDPHNPGTATRLNLVYPAPQRQRLTRTPLDAIFVAGNCAVEILRRPGPALAADGLRHADASAMALVVFPHARVTALALVRRCLSGVGAPRQYRFGYTGTRSVLGGLGFDYVVAVTLWPGDASLRNPGEHFYDRDGEIQAPGDDAQGYGGVLSFPYDRAFD